MKKLDVIAQSKAAYGQWKEQWREHAKHHAKHAPFKPFTDFENSGIGRACLLVANGYSFEENIETIKKYKDNVDILCCDKTLGHLLDNGIKPKFCLVADANVDYERYMEPWKDQLQDTTLVVCITANIKWTDNGNWKQKYFFCVKDAIQTELEFCELSGCKNVIPAGTNVSNSMVLFLTQSDNNAARNYFGYDKYILIGFDYSWRYGKNYYAFDNDGNGKTNYMKHIYLLTRGGEHGYSSTNLAFSAQWLDNYLGLFKLPVVSGSDATILGQAPIVNLEKALQYKYKPQDSEIVREKANLIRYYQQKVLELGNELSAIAFDHRLAHLKT